MNQRQKEVLKSQLRDEKKIINDLKKIYKEALTDINQKVAVLMVDESMQSKIYQVGYQNRLKKQIEASLELLNSGQYEKIHNYLQDCYSSGFIGAMYDLHGQGIPLIMPIDQKAMVKAVQTDSKISKGLYTKLGKDVGDLKKRITSEVSRGVAQALPYKDVTRNLNNVARIGLNRSMRIARTEGHRITQASALDGMRSAKSAGADVLKQWDATLDGHTRDHHRELDGQIRDVDDDFEVGGMTVEAPGMFGDLAEDCNCRCCLLQRARWELDESELDTLRERADYFGLDKEKDFDDFKVKYLNSVEKIGKNVIMTGARILNPDSEKGKAFAKMYYSEIRKFSTDTARIAANIGTSQREVDEVKKYLFSNDFFEPDCAIAQSWQRLMLGKDIKEHDIVLIQHELYEMRIKKENPLIDHVKAHEMATKKYNYQKGVDEYYGNLKGNKKRK